MVALGIATAHEFAVSKGSLAYRCFLSVFVCAVLEMVGLIPRNAHVFLFLKKKSLHYMEPFVLLHTTKCEGYFVVFFNFLFARNRLCCCILRIIWFSFSFLLVNNFPEK